ncbi:nuclear transport factor 2 family protein [Paraburkholderia sp. SIMBA_049]
MEEKRVRDRLLARYDAWMCAIADKDIDFIAAIYADDAVYMPPGQPRHVGKAAILSAWRKYFERPDFRATYTPSLVVSKSMDLAYDVGSYVITLTRENAPAEVRGKYVVVWKPQGGDWVVAVDIDNTDQPL